MDKHIFIILTSLQPFNYMYIESRGSLSVTLVYSKKKSSGSEWSLKKWSAV